MHTLLALVALLQSPAPGADTARVYSGSEGALQVSPPRMDASVEIDGVLQEEVWARAARLADFTQYGPVDGQPAVNPTEVLVWYSATAIYFGVRASAPPGTVRAHLADRDEGIASDDDIEIQLGTYHDGRQAFVFAVNPLGVQADGALVEGTHPRVTGQDASAGRESADLSPDYLFDSKGRLTDDGYEIEIRIPFRSLRYPSEQPQTWSLQIIRRSAATGREDTWAPALRAAPSFIGQSGSLVGLQGLSRGRVLELNPEATSTVEGSPQSGGWDYRGGRPELGANLTWGLTSNLSVNGTVNPDFSQVESDAGQVTSDPRRALYFTEKRPFFLDGLEYFSTPSRVIYTRRILAPVAAAKLTGTVAGTSFGFLSAVDAAIGSSSGQQHPFYNILRVQRGLGAASRLGLAYTDRVEGGDYNRVAQLDGRLVLSPLNTASFYGALSRTRVAGATTTAPIWSAALERTGRRLGVRATFSGVSDHFEASSGFIQQGDLVESSLTPSLTFYGRPGAFIERFTATMVGQLVWSYSGFRAGRPARDRRLILGGGWRLRGGWDVTFNTYQFDYGFDERLYQAYGIEVPTATGVDTVPYRPGDRIPTLAWTINLHSPEVAGFSLSSYTAWGKDVNYDEFSAARIFLTLTTLAYRPTSQLRVESHLPVLIYHRWSDGSLVSRTLIPRLKVEYQLSRSIFVRIVGEYRAYHRDSLRDDSRTERPILIRDADGIYRREPALAIDQNDLRMDFLFSYQPSPGTVFFAGYGSSLVEDDPFRFRGLTRTRDAFFTKLSYVFHL